MDSARHDVSSHDQRAKCHKYGIQMMLDAECFRTDTANCFIMAAVPNATKPEANDNDLCRDATK